MTIRESQTITPSEKLGFAEKQASVLTTVESSFQETVGKGRRSRGHMATIKNDDERLLARIGYRQVRCIVLYS